MNKDTHVLTAFQSAGSLAQSPKITFLD